MVDLINQCQPVRFSPQPIVQDGGIAATNKSKDPPAKVKPATTQKPPAPKPAPPPKPPAAAPGAQDLTSMVQNLLQTHAPPPPSKRQKTDRAAKTSTADDDGDADMDDQ